MIKKNSKTQKCQNRHGKKCTQFRGKNVYYSNIQELSRKLNIPIIQARKIEKDNGRRIIIGPGNDTLLINIKDENFSGLLKKIFNIKRINNKQLIEDTHIQNKNLDIVKELGPNAEGKYMLTITMYISFPSPSYVDEEEILTKGKVDNNKIQELLDEDNPRLVKRLLNDVYNGYNDEIPSYVKNKVMEFMKRMKNSKPKLLHHEFRIGDAYKNRKLNFKKGYVRDFNNVFELTEWVNIEYNKDIFNTRRRYYPLSVRLGNAIVSYVRYIGKALWPSRLAVFYTHPELQAWNVMSGLLLLLAITAFVFYRRREGFLAVGWFWFLGTLVPMIGIVQVGEQAMADRYAYLSFIGLFIMICWGVSELADRRHLAPATLLAPSAVVLLILAFLTYRQLSYWSDNVTLWTRMQAISSGSYEVEENLGVALLDSGQQAPAMEHFQQVVALVPSSGAIGRELAGYAAVAHLYLGAYYQQHGQPAVAIAHYEQVLSLAQDFTSQNVNAKVPPVLIRMKAAALGNMGDAYYALHNFAEARTAYQSALQMDPRNAHKWIGLGVVEQRSGDAASAAQAFSHATQLQPSDVAFLLLAQALEQSGQSQQAQAAREQASLRSQNLAAAQQTVDRLISQ